MTIVAHKQLPNTFNLEQSLQLPSKCFITLKKSCIKFVFNKFQRETVDLCQKAEHAGVSWIAVHGRTKDQRAEPVNKEAIKTIKESIRIPVVANGDIKSLQDVEEIRDVTNVDGVMAARGILQNPAMYSGFENTPLQCVQDWVSFI